MSKIDVLIIVHSEHEGLLSVGNSERARCGMVARESVPESTEGREGYTRPFYTLDIITI